jgi:phosphatidylglycerophosphate synthase
MNPHRVGSVLRGVYTGSMTTVARPQTTQQQAVAAGAHVVLLVTLSACAGLGPTGLAAGFAYIVGLCGLLTGAVRRAEATRLGPADLVTLTRAVLVGAVTAIVADALFRSSHTPVALLVALAATALALDAVDGQVARRSGTVSALGARFDMEVDAFLVLVLSVYVATLMGPWVLAIGVMRYAFVAASWMAPWMRSALPTRYSAKTVAAWQGIALVVAASQVLLLPLAIVVVSSALASLVWSFGRDVVWLWRHADVPQVPEQRRQSV